MISNSDWAFAIVIVIFALGFFFLLLWFYHQNKLRRLKKIYNVEEDKSFQGEQLRSRNERGARTGFRGSGGEPIPRISSKYSNEQFTPSRIHGLPVPIPDTTYKQVVGKDSDSRRKKKRDRRRRIL